MKVVDTNKKVIISGIESTICEYILVSKQVSVSTDTIVQSIGIGIELKILVSPNTSNFIWLYVFISSLIPLLVTWSTQFVIG